MVVENGTFTMSSQEIFSTCDEQLNVYNGDFEITIEGQNFTMGDDWTGKWDADARTARGDSEIERSRNHRGCAISTWTTVDITFISPDEFTGNVYYRRRVTDDGECETPCNVTWGVDGLRK